VSATTELAFDRLNAVGAIPVNTSPADPKWERARLLIDMAYEQVLSYLNLTEATVAELSDQLRGVIATVLAEMASSRLQYNAAPSTEGYIPEGLMSSLMAPRHKRALDAAFRQANGGSISIVVERDESSSWLSPYIVTP
jgi:hypothetical protein